VQLFPPPPPADHTPRPSRAARALRGFRLLSAAALLVPLLAVVGAGLLSWHEVRGEAEARLTRTLGMLQQHALRALGTQETILAAIEQSLEERSWDELRASASAHQLLAQLAAAGAPLVGNVRIVGPDQVVTVASDRFPARPENVAGWDVMAAIGSGAAGTVLGRPDEPGTATVPTFAVARARPVPEGALPGSAGTIISSFSPQAFATFYEEIREAEEDSVALLRRDGELLVRVPEPQRDLAREPVADWLASDLTGPNSSFGFSIRTSPVDGVERLYAARQVGDYPLFVVYGLEAGAIRRAWILRMLPPAAGGLVAAGLLLGLTWVAHRGARREQEAAELRAAADAQLARVGHAATIGLLAAGLAHDFKNLVQTVRSGARVMRRHATEPEEVRRCADLLADSAERGHRLVEGLLGFARSGASGPTAPLDVASTLRGLSDLLNRTLGGGYRVELELAGPEPMPRALGDRAGLEAAVVNLAANARDAMPQGGVVTIRAFPTTAPGAEAPPDAAPTHLAVSVRDHGIGMDADTLARVGEAFFTTKPPGEGTGLGLATVRGFVEGHGGSLHLDSRVGEGTTATIYLLLVNQ
jgi:two-component system NtrC family sensor kinase